MVAGMRATISGRVGGGLLRSTEVSGETYDRYRRIKSMWGFNNDQMADLATDGGRHALDEASLGGLLVMMEASAEEMTGTKGRKTGAVPRTQSG